MTTILNCNYQQNKKEFIKKKFGENHEGETKIIEKFSHYLSSELIIIFD